MKKLLAISLIVAGTFASTGIASADTLYSGEYGGWASDAFTSASQN